MGTVDTLRGERNGRTVPLTSFFEAYKSDSTCICYGFVEGKDDPSYYRNAINNKIRLNCTIQLFPSNGKENVKYVFEEIRKRNYNHDKIIYIMDRDLSDVIDDSNIIEDPFVYITDNYSFENDILNENTLSNVMRDLLGFSETSLKELNIAKDTYKKIRMSFEDRMLPIMANIIIWKRNNTKPANYNNLDVKRLFKIDKCILEEKKGGNDAIKELYKCSEVDFTKYDANAEKKMIGEIKKKSSPSKILRGKYLSPLFIMFCNSLYKDSSMIGVTRTHKGRLLCEKDIIETIAVRARIPDSLSKFIDNTLVRYFDKVA